MNVDFNRLRIFYYIHSSLSITAAADQLHITPSAVSQQLKKLEEEMDTRLFIRLHKRLVPTATGVRLFQLVKPLLTDLDTGLKAIREELSEPAGLLRIGAPMEFGSRYLPHIIASFCNRYPKVKFTLELGRPGALLGKVNRAEVDFAFVDTFPTRSQPYGSYQNFTISPIIEEQVVLACSRTYFNSHIAGDESCKRLESGQFISQQPDARAITNWFLHHFGKPPGQLDIVVQVENHQAVLSSIRHNLGMGIIVSHLAWDDIRSGTIVIIRGESEQTKNRISLVQLRDKIPSAAEKTFIAHFNVVATKSKTLQQLKLIPQ
ncbi:LysR family transcriptional regulator [Desulforhopalus singaporensis]|uniref:DNA-binding transcriptional regulator, LysR family n=1 Tax=Desulforhopalus singaporensis TaxID=91360 RepID=A0A1H0N7L3_9BACT|nr:LysR family transcriptional regulator [Desulforhopalus singaporensis]SDO88719.1 DNA-binding transcriptional regulator, LysR family [Desulforhopalus singaporensis]